MRKDVPNFLLLFRFVRYSDLYTHQNPWLLLLHSAGHRDAGLFIEMPFVTFVPIVTWEKMSPIFWDFFVSLRFSIYTHQNPWLLLLHTARHRDAGLIIETPFVTFVPIVTRKKRCPQFYIDKCPEEFLVRSTLNFCYICYSVTGVTKCVCWKICVLFVKYLGQTVRSHVS